MTAGAADRTDELNEAADRIGLARSYVDAAGRRVRVGKRTLQATIAALAAEDIGPRETLLPDAIVVRRNGRPMISLGDRVALPARWTIAAASQLSGITETSAFELPRELPAGAYRFEVWPNKSADPESAVLVVAPREVYQGADRSARFWLLAVQLYGIRSRTNWGHGDFGDLARLLDLAASLGAAGVGLNPLHALMNESEENVSPYSPSSRLFLNFLYIDVDALPEFSAVAKDDLRSRITALREAEMVDYLGVAAVKREALRRCYTRFKEDGRESDDFEQFRHERGEALEKFARFEAAREHGSNVAAEELRYHAYVQWRADRQLRACRDKAGALGLPIGLYLDLAVGVRSDGADAESAPGVYFRGVTIGAPPDLLNLQGQDWGLTAYHPRSIERQKFAPFREMLAANMRYAGALRVDHVLWLNRVYLVPRGLAPSEGCYIHYPLEALLGVLAIESDANRCCVIGEDLGTVPPELREALKRWGVWTYHVMQFERDETGAFRSADMYQERALATFATHDLPPFAAWLSGSDLKLKRGIGIDPGESDAERARATSRLASALAATGEAIQFDQIARFLAATPTRLVAVGLEDALALRELTNVPGTTTQHPNWRRKLPVLLEDLPGDERLRRLSAAFDDHGRSIAAATNK